MNVDAIQWVGALSLDLGELDIEVYNNELRTEATDAARLRALRETVQLTLRKAAAGL